MVAQETVAVLGAGGTMGLPMARNIAKAGRSVRAWNRSPEKAEPLAADGVTVLGTPAEATGPRQRRDVARRARAGNEEAGAEEGTLVVLASGPQDARDRVQPIFDAIGQKTIWAGEAGAGTRLKVVTNSWVLTVTEACAEMIALAQAMDLDPSLILDAISGGALDLPYLRMKTRAILEHDFEPMFKLKLAAKDAGLVKESAERHGAEVPLFEVIRRQMSKAAERHGDQDMAATYFASAPAQGSS